MTRMIVAKEKIDCTHLLGKFLDESHYDILIEEDCNVYTPPMCDVSTTVDCQPQTDCATCTRGITEDRVAFVFRKNYFSKEQQEAAYNGLREGATKTNNRGIAAGSERVGSQGTRVYTSKYQEAVFKFFLKPYSPLSGEDPLQAIIDQKDSLQGNGEFDQVWLASIQLDFDAWVEETRKLPAYEQTEAARYVIDTYLSATKYANEVHSGIAGAFGRVPRMPWGRLAAYNARNPEKFEKAIPFLQTLNAGFAELLPQRHAAQKQFTDKLDPKFVIDGTVFTTLTINKTFRTAAHLDAGDYGPGFSNLLVLSNDGNYTGGYLILPEYRIAVNVRPGDLLLIANHTAIHGNTPIELGSETSERVSVVAYAREDLANLGTWEYEQVRQSYVDACRTNREHHAWWERTTGVWAGMWQSKEWYDYLINAMGEEEARKNDPEIFALHDKIDLDSFFS